MTKAINPLNNAIEAKNNYRVLQPYSITDPNQNLSMVRFDALGFVVATAVMGKYKNGEWEGDFLERSKCEIQPDQDKPTTELEYDLFQWQKIGKPNYVKIRAREIHKDENTPWQESYLYSDGFGRQVQTKVQAEPGDANKIDSDGYLVTEHAKSRWVGTGRKIYNNKGKPVKQYEPFFSSTHEYEDEALVVETGVTPILFYDSLERVICTIHPNHTYKKVVFDPWKQETWDVNDTVYPLEKFDRVHFDPADPVYPDHTFNPANDADVGYYISVLPEEDYLPTWYNLRMDASKALKTWPDTGRNEEKERNERIRISEKSAAQKAAKHCATPTAAHLDSLGRVFLTIADNGLDKNGNLQLLETRVKLDIESNDLTITDPRNIIVFQHQFDIAGRKLFVNSVDAGRSALLADVAGNPIRSQDANGNWTSVEYDELRRPTETIVHRTTPYNDTITSQIMVYGESLVKEIAIKNNQRGQVYAIFGGAGAVFNLSYDFKGSLEQSIRRLTKTYKTDEVNWKDIPAIDFVKPLFELESKLKPLLAKETFFTSTSYDALNRITETTSPDHSLFNPGDVEPPDGSKYIYGYNEANLLEKVTVNLKKEDDDSRADQVFVSDINYNAKGQREKIVYGNDVETKYTYDPQTFRLIKLKSNKSDGTKVQELSYIYDPVGNIIQIHDGAFKSVFNCNNEIKPESCYTYDPTYRLIEATGREHEAMTACHYKEKDKKQSEFIGLTNQPTNNGQVLGKYTEKYEYDPSGNITLIDHINHTYRTHWKRYQKYGDDSNRILSSMAKDQEYDAAFTEIISEVPACENEDDIPHDLNGNIEALAHLRVRQNSSDPIYKNLKWNFKNELVQAELNQSGDTAYYQYDASGQRVRKTVVKGSTIEERIYLGGYEIYCKRNGQNGTNLKLERQTLHVMDDKKRIALVETRTAGDDPDDSRWRRFRYQLDNHLGSSVMEIEWAKDQNGQWQSDILSYEEYYPYGGTAYIAGRSKDNEIAPEVKRKRYRYSGKERDDETTGLYYYGARYYASWLGRWVSCDPSRQKEDGLNIYAYVRNNPVKLVDPDGMQSAERKNLNKQTEENIDHTYWDKMKVQIKSESLLAAREAINYLTGPFGNLGLSTNLFQISQERMIVHYLIEHDQFELAVRIATGKAEYFALNDLAETKVEFLRSAIGQASGMNTLLAGITGEDIFTNELTSTERVVSIAQGSSEVVASSLITSSVVKFGILKSMPLNIVGEVYRYSRRDIVFVRTSKGLQAFYRSTGESSDQRGKWFPFDEITAGWYNKKSYCENIPEKSLLYRLGSQEFKIISEKLEKMNIPEGKLLDNGFKVNQLMDKQGARITANNVNRGSE